MDNPFALKGQARNSPRETWFATPVRRAARLVVPHANSTTETELNGIKVAATSGDKPPAAATLTPIRL